MQFVLHKKALVWAQHSLSSGLAEKVQRFS